MDWQAFFLDPLIVGSIALTDVRKSALRIPRERKRQSSRRLSTFWPIRGRSTADRPGARVQASRCGAFAISWGRILRASASAACPHGFTGQQHLAAAMQISGTDPQGARRPWDHGRITAGPLRRGSLDRQTYQKRAAFDVLYEAAQARRLGVVILDACRDNPLAESLRAGLGPTRAAAVGRGLARIERPLVNTLVAFATEPNAEASDTLTSSEATRELLTQLRRQGVDDPASHSPYAVALLS